MRLFQVISMSKREEGAGRPLWSYFTLALIYLVFVGGCSCRSETKRTQPTAEHPLPQDPSSESPSALPKDQAANRDESPNSTSDSANAKNGSSKGQITGSIDAQAGDATTPANRSKLHATTPAEAFLNGRQLLKAADKAATAGHVGKAYEKALAAWQGLQPHRNNDDCRRLSKEALGTLERYGEAANKKSLSATGNKIRRKPIVVK